MFTLDVCNKMIPPLPLVPPMLVFDPDAPKKKKHTKRKRVPRSMIEVILTALTIITSPEMYKTSIQKFTGIDLHDTKDMVIAHTEESKESKESKDETVDVMLEEEKTKTPETRKVKPTPSASAACTSYIQTWMTKHCFDLTNDLCLDDYPLFLTTMGRLLFLPSVDIAKNIMTNTTKSASKEEKRIQNKRRNIAAAFTLHKTLKETNFLEPLPQMWQFVELQKCLFLPNFKTNTITTTTTTTSSSSSSSSCQRLKLAPQVWICRWSCCTVPCMWGLPVLRPSSWECPLRTARCKQHPRARYRWRPGVESRRGATLFRSLRNLGRRG